MPRLTLREYIDSKGKIVEKPINYDDKDKIVDVPKDGVVQPPKGWKSKDGKVPQLKEGKVAAFNSFNETLSHIASNPLMIEHFMLQAKKMGLLPVLVGEMLDYEETLVEMSKVMAHKKHGKKLSKRLVRAMNEVSFLQIKEQVDKPMLDDYDDETDHEEVEDLEDHEDELSDEEDHDLESDELEDEDLEDQDYEDEESLDDDNLEDNADHHDLDSDEDVEKEGPPAPKMAPAMENFLSAMKQIGVYNEQAIRDQVVFETIYPVVEGWFTGFMKKPMDVVDKITGKVIDNLKDSQYLRMGGGYKQLPTEATVRRVIQARFKLPQPTLEKVIEKMKEKGLIQPENYEGEAGHTFGHGTGYTR